MEKISYRGLQRVVSGELLKRLPLCLQVDSQSAAVILSIEQYNKLVREYREKGEQK